MDLPFPQALAFQQLLQLPCSKRRLFARVERKRSAEQWAELAKVNQNKQWNKKSKQKAGRRTILGYGLIWINNDGLIWILMEIIWINNDEYGFIWMNMDVWDIFSWKSKKAGMDPK